MGEGRKGARGREARGETLGPDGFFPRLSPSDPRHSNQRLRPHSRTTLSDTRASCVSRELRLSPGAHVLERHAPAGVRKASSTLRFTCISTFGGGAPSSRSTSARTASIFG